MSINIIANKLSSVQDMMDVCEKIWNRDDIPLEDKIAFHDTICLGKIPKMK